MPTPQDPVQVPNPKNYLDASAFTVLIYQDLGPDSPSRVELSHLSSAVIDYNFSESVADAYNDEYFPDSWYADQDDDDDEDEEEIEGEGDGADDPITQTVEATFLVNRAVLAQIQGEFPLPDDSDLVMEVTHYDKLGTPVFRHTFRGGPTQNLPRHASLNTHEPLTTTLTIICESIKLFELC